MHGADERPKPSKKEQPNSPKVEKDTAKSLTNYELRNGIANFQLSTLNFQL
jgi:hypothetical protein